MISKTVFISLVFSIGISLLLQSTLYADAPLTEENVNAQIVKYAKDIHNLRVTASAGGPAILFRGWLHSDPPLPKSADIVLHAKVETPTGYRGDAALGFTAEGGDFKQADPTESRGSIIFRSDRRMPSSGKEATRLFDRICGKGTRSAIYRNASFQRGDDGNWILFGEFAQSARHGKSGFKIRAVVTIGPDDDDPSTLIIAMISEIGVQ